MSGPYLLRKGDSDADRRWGGVHHAQASGSYVADLQRALVDVGVLTNGPDGAFGAKTEAGLKRFQWYLQNIPVRLNAAGQAVPYQCVTALATNGVLGAVTRQVLAAFVNMGCACAGPLVRVEFSTLPRFRPGSGFHQLIAGTSAMVVDGQFAQMLTAMNAKAQKESLFVHVQQVFRLDGVAVNNPVVPPAGHSAHKIGRAIDMQLGTTAGAPVPAATMMNAPANSPMGRFRDHMKNLGCRYGGSFTPKDPPHYDQQIMPTSSDAWKNRFFFAQQQYSSQPGPPVTRIPAP